jgi:superfamily I DNA/RNA helicase
MALTVQQVDFTQELLNGTSHVALVARAGTGKTFSILEAVDAYVKAFPQAEITICCFGKDIQLEVANKLKLRGHTDWKKVQASTTHSMGWGVTRYVFKITRDPDDNKVYDLVKGRNDPFYDEYCSQICQMVSLAKKEGFGFFDDSHIGDTHAWYRLAEHYGINDLEDTSLMDRVVSCSQLIYQASLDKTDVVDYDDMILFPLVKNIRVRFQRDVIFVDEAQDTSRARRALLKKFLKRNGRMIVVGDPQQAIMGFAGASAHAMQEFIAELDAKVMPLTMTWRCPKAVVRLAQTIVPDIEAAPDAIEGSISNLPNLPQQMEMTDAILCRNNAPLVAAAYSLIRRRIPCKVKGRKIGDGLVKMVDRWKKITTIGAFLDKLSDWQERETQKALAKNKQDKVEEIVDKSDTLRVICEAVRAAGRQDLDGVRAYIKDLFSDDIKGVVTLSSYHRSKGLEFPRVFLLEHAKRSPSPYAKQDWQREQEAHLAYVAYTRSMKDLFFVEAA